MKSLISIFLQGSEDSTLYRAASLIRRSRTITRLEVANTLGITMPTASRYVKELVEAGIVIEEGTAPSSGGRKPIIYRFEPAAFTTIGIEVEPEGIRAVMTDLDIHVRYETVHPLSGAESSAKLFEILKESVDELVSLSGRKSEYIAGLGISLPGVVHTDERILEYAPNMIKMKDVDFSLFEKAVGIPVFPENEANLSVKAEKYLGGGESEGSLVFVSVKSSGIGGGILMDGRLFRGAHSRAAEFGHFPIQPEGRLCSCGRRGCWERYASYHALEDEIKAVSGNEPLSVEDFFKRVDEGDSKAKSAWEAYLSYFASGILGIISSMDPEKIVIGGRLTPLGARLLEPLSAQVRLSSASDYFGNTQLALSELGENAALLGAALLPVERLYGPVVAASIST